MAWKSDLGETN